MTVIYTLNDLSVGEEGTVLSLRSAGPMRRRLLDIGLIEHTPVQCISQSPFRDPKAYLIRGAVIAIRNEDCQNIYIKKSKEDVPCPVTFSRPQTPSKTSHCK